MAGSLGLWLRWSRRDLRKRWVLVSTIAFIIAIGTGMFAGLGATATWRRMSNDASYSRLAMHDVRVVLGQGSFVPQGTLSRVAGHIPAAPSVAAVQERLVAPVLVDASGRGRTVLVPGRVVGTGSGDVDRVHVARGTGNGAVLDSKFAGRYDLPTRGTVRVAGGRRIPYGGLGYGPEYFVVTDRAAGFFGEANFAVMFLPLTDAQAVVDRPRSVNDLVVRLAPGTDSDAVREELEEALSRELPDASATVTTRADDPGHRILYEDIENDQQFWNLFAFLVLVAAGFAAFNLVSRIVESERREIGVGMALGARPLLLAVRPLLVGTQIALLGVLAGVGVGLLVGAGMRSLLTSFLPLPVWRTPFQAGMYAEAALLGFLLPLVATALPVWRAVRVEPVQAIRTGAYAPVRGRGRLIEWWRRVPLRGRRTLTQMPFRNVLRAPRRSLLTILGVAGAITALVVVLGALDSWLGSVAAGEAELVRMAPGRLTVELDRFYPEGSHEVISITGARELREAEPGLRVVGRLEADGTLVDVATELVDMKGAMWTPTLLEPAPGDVTRGIVISEKAARDLAVRPGDTVTLIHPVREGPESFRLAETPVTVTALHPNPLRPIAYMDHSLAGMFGLSGEVNVVQVQPAAGVSEGEVKRAMFRRRGVASVQPVAVMARLVRDLVDDFVGILRLLQIAVLALALLIAFNSASIGVDERAREEATMFAFGVRLRSVLGVVTAESVLLGLAGTAIGLGTGYLVLRWAMEPMMSETMPEFGIRAAIAPGTFVATVLLGVLAVALAPLLTVRRLRRMDVPATLRVLE